MESISVKSCTKTKDWEKDGKKVPIYKVELTDGRTGESFGKEIPLGTPVDQLELQEGQYGTKVKWNQPRNGNGGGWGRSAAPKGNESFALSYAKDVAVAHIGQGKEFKSAQILDVADAFYNWLESKKQK